MDRTVNIGLVGKVSSGKSALVSAIAGGFVSNNSLLRETLNPSHYIFSPDGDEHHINVIGDKLAKDKAGDEVREKIKEMRSDEISRVIRYCDNDNKLPSRYDIGKMTITDMAGLDDSDDIKNKFFNVFRHKYTDFDVVMYVTDATQAFRDKSEVDTFNKIKKLIDRHNKIGNYIELIIIINKYDDDDDEDLEKIYNKVIMGNYVDQGHVFRISSHKLMIDNIIRHKVDLYVPNDYCVKELKKILKNGGKYPMNIVSKECIRLKCKIKHKIDGDLDNFIPYLKNIDCVKNRASKSYQKYCRNILETCRQYYGGDGFIDTSPSDHTYVGIMSKLDVDKFKECKLDEVFIDCAKNIITSRLSTNNKIRIRLLENVLEYFSHSDQTHANILNDMLKWIITNIAKLDNNTIMVANAYFFRLLLRNSFVCDQDILSSLNEGIDTLMCWVVCDDDCMCHAFSVENWRMCDKKMYNNVIGYKGFAEAQFYGNYFADLINADYVENGIKGKYWYILSLRRFTLREIICMHISNDIYYQHLKGKFSMVKRNIEWIISNNIDVTHEKWCRIFDPYWDDVHKKYEISKRMFMNLEPIKRLALSYEEPSEYKKSNDVSNENTNSDSDSDDDSKYKLD
jgi:GTPase SAR1 family protein